MSDTAQEDMFLELIPQLKTLISTGHEEQARNIIATLGPHNAALLKTLKTLGLVHPDAVKRLLIPPSPSNALPPPTSTGLFPPVLAAPPAPAPLTPVAPALAPVPLPQPSPTPIIPLAPTPASNASALLATLPPDQQDLVRMIISLTPEQLASVPPGDREKFTELRRQFAGL